MKKTLGHESKSIFTRRFEILLFAVRATEPVTTAIVIDVVLNVSRRVARDCLDDLADCGLMEKISTTKYTATEFAKELMGVKA